MRALIADDDRLTTMMLKRAMTKLGFEPAVVHDGEAAWRSIVDDAPPIAIVDWEMPGLDGIDLCRRVRQDPTRSHLYIVLLTSRAGHGDLVAGLEAGADDYLTKPFEADELRARINVGLRIVTLQQRLSEQVTALQTALASIRQLRGLLPICSYCKRIRRDDDYWEQLEQYISDHSEAQFSHGICPGCYPRVLAEVEASAEARR